MSISSVNPVSQNNWFSVNVEYEGQGRAEFFNPIEIVEGLVKIKFDEFGGSSVAMKLDSLKDWEKFRNQNNNTSSCTRLTVTTPQGIFSSTEIFFCSPRYESADDMWLDFYLLRSHFDVTGAGAAKYWVFPLSNFLSTFVRRHPDLDRHPLRIYPTPTIAENLPNIKSLDDITIEYQNAIINANQKNQLIHFEFNGSLGFIEPLADYYERQEKLRKGRERNLITAVMVGEVSSNSIDFTDLKQWLPLDFRLSIGLATGTEVGLPWIEFRDENGQLVRRIHASQGRPFFSEGHVAIREDLARKDACGIGYLLTKSLSSPNYGQPHLRAALQHVVLGGLYSSSLEDKLIHLCQALDGLCKEYGLDRQDLLLDLDDVDKQNLVKEILESAAKDIRNAKATTSTAGQNNQSRILDQIANRTISAAQKDRHFGLAVTKLLKKFNLPDADIIDTHYQAKSLSNGTEANKWSELLSCYRGGPIHRGYFNFDGVEHNQEDVLRITRHLHDILLRIIFKLLCYDGTYIPTIANMTVQQSSSGYSVITFCNSPMPIDWITPDIPASQLGY